MNYDNECLSMIETNKQHYMTWYLIANWTRNDEPMVSDRMYEKICKGLKENWAFIPRNDFVELANIDDGPTSYPQNMQMTVNTLKRTLGKSK